MTPEIAAGILNVPAGATRAEIDKQFRKQARTHHPDLLAGASAETLAAATTEFVRMSAARDVLHGELDRVASKRTDADAPKRAPAAARQAAAPDPASTAAPSGPSGPSGPSATGTPAAGPSAADPRGADAREAQQQYPQQRPAENPQAQFGPRAGWTTRGPDDPYIRRGPVPPPPSPVRRTPMDPRDSRLPRQAPGTPSNPLDPESFQYPPVRQHPPAQDPHDPAARPNPQYGAPLPLPIERRRAFVDRRDPGRAGLPYPNDRRRPPADRRNPGNADAFPENRHSPHPDTFHRAGPRQDPGAPDTGAPSPRARHSSGPAADGDARAADGQGQGAPQSPPQSPQQRPPAHEERRGRPASFVPPGFVPVGGTPMGSMPAAPEAGAAGLPGVDPQASPMSFADFVLARDARSWIPYVENTLPPTPPRRTG